MEETAGNKLIDPDLALIAIKEDCGAAALLGKELMKDRDFLCKLLSIVGDALEYLEECKSDKDLVLTAMGSSVWSLSYASNVLRSETAVIKVFLELFDERWGKVAIDQGTWSKVEKCLCGEPSLEDYEKLGMLFSSVSLYPIFPDKLRDNVDIALKHMEMDTNNLLYLPPVFADNKEFIYRLLLLAKKK